MEENRLDQFLEILVGSQLQPGLFVKLAVLLGLFLYLGFALMIVRQVDLMSNSLEGAFGGPLKLVARAYLIGAIGIFLLAIFLL